MNNRSDQQHKDDEWLSAEDSTRSPWQQLIAQFSRNQRLLLVIGSLIVLLIVAGYSFTWTGFQGKTLWDWMRLLIVPAAIAGGGYLLTRAENRRTQTLASQSEQDATLRSYLDQMTTLMLEQGLCTSKEDNEGRNIARASTLVTLRKLNTERKTHIIQFLYESGLLDADEPIIRLGGAGMVAGIVTGGADLKGVNLSFFYLENINLEGVDLSNSNLAFATLRGANLSSAHLFGITMNNADLSDANLSDVIAGESDLSDSFLAGANLERASLWGVDLSGADLTRANLKDVDLAGFIPSEPGMLVANLENANLSDVTVSEEELSYCSLKGATMPDGSIHN